MSNETSNLEVKVSKASIARSKRRNTRTEVEAEHMILEHADTINPLPQVSKRKSTAIDKTTHVSLFSITCYLLLTVCLPGTTKNKRPTYH